MKDRLRPMYCDHLSIVRNKILPEHKIESCMTRFAQPCFAVHYDKDLIVDAPGTQCLTGMPDMELRWNEADVRTGWQPSTKVVLGDLCEQNGSPVEISGRHILKKAVSDWQALGLAPKIGIELECYAFALDEAGGIKPYETPGGVVYGVGPFNDSLGFTDAIWETAEEMGLSLDMMTSEYDAPQFEFTLTFDDAVKAVDDVVIFRQMAREIALEFGVLLTFLPKPIAETGGSGMHINVSFADKDGKNAFANGEVGGVDAMNDLSKACVAGWMKHHKALAGLIASNATSFARLQPASLSGYWCNWGGDHRGVTVRVSGEGGAKARLEHRMADAAANPYASVAAVLQAARLGLIEKYELPKMETGDTFVQTDATIGTAENLAEALDDLVADTKLTEAVGQLYCDHHVHMKRAEVEKTQALEGDALRDWYIWYV